MALNAKASSANTRTVWRMAWSSTIRKGANNCRATAPVAKRRTAGDAPALQLFRRVPNVVERHVIRDIRRADAWRNDKPDFSAFEFFVELHCIENFLTRKIPRQTRGQT